MSNTLCSYVFAHTNIDPNGDIEFCCAVQGGAHRDPEGRVYNVQTHTIKEAWNSPQIRNTRMAMIRGERPEMCNYCWRMENEDNTQGNSVRLYSANKRISLDSVQDRIEYARTHDGALSDEFLAFEFQLSIGNLCNLACKMCNTGFSTQYQKFFSRFHNSPNEISFVLGYPNINQGHPEFGTTFDWPTKQPLAEIFADHLQTVQQIFFTGGEPTLIPQVKEFIDHLADVEKRQDFNPWVSTNCTNINKELIDSLEKFNSVSINMSLDGMDDIAYIQRTPSHWPSLEKNIDTLFDWLLTTEKTDVCLNVHTTVTALNLHHVVDFWKYLDIKYQSRFGVGIGLILNKDINFGIEIIPKTVAEQLKKQVQHELKYCSDRLKVAYLEFEKILDNTNFADDFESIHFCLDQVQRYHPDLDIRQIYSIYYN